MKAHKAYKTELDPTDAQVVQLLRHTGCARWAYNWGLRRKQAEYEATGKSPNAMALQKELAKLKKMPVEEGGVPWMYESSKHAPQAALWDLDEAFNNFFRRCKQKAAKKGFPRYKSKKQGIGSFRVYGARAFTSHIQLPRLGKIKLKESNYLPISDVKVLSATVSERAGKWFVSLLVEETIVSPPKALRVLGVDVGLKHLAVTSDGQVFENPKALAKAQKLLRVRQKAFSRKAKGSKNRAEAIAKLAKLHYKVANVRKDAIHKMTTAITKQATTIVIESLNVAGMMKNHKLARATSDASLAEIHRQLEYKSKWHGIELVKADRFFPSTKTCSGCGKKRELPLSERVYSCDGCGLAIDRDLNAAINLKSLAGSSSASVYCPDSSGPKATSDETVGWVGTGEARISEC